MLLDSIAYQAKCFTFRFFTREATWGQFLIIDQLKTDRQCLIDATYAKKKKWKKEEESTNNLLLYCPKVSILWQLVFYLFRIARVMHSMLRENLVSWNISFIGKKRVKSFVLILKAMEGNEWEIFWRFKTFG